MSTIIDSVKGEALRKAVDWICEQNTYTLASIEEASRRFDLSPLDENFLIDLFSKRKLDTNQGHGN
jgi:hypothetical protein